MEASVRNLFDRYARLFNQALEGDLALDQVACLYAAEFIAATPAGVVAGKNDDQLKHIMTQGFARYRAIGTRQMRIRRVAVSPIDGHHCVAHVAWTAIYARHDLPETAIDFDVHYLVQMLAGEPKVFGWISGDEEALLRQHGII
jgi:hypothetical protein